MIFFEFILRRAAGIRFERAPIRNEVRFLIGILGESLLMWWDQNFRIDPKFIFRMTRT